MVREQIAGGAKGPHAIRQVAQRRGCSPARLRCWLERVLEEEAGGVAAVEALADRPRSGRPPKVWDLTGAEVAWRLWRRYFLRLEAPPASVCRQRVRVLADTRGWQIPSAKTFLRRLRAEIPAQVVIRAREGRLAAMATFPFQSRSVEGMKPLQYVNGDGYTHNLMVLPPGGGKPMRPVTWTWQDVRTRKILAHRSGPTESSDLVRTALHDLCKDYGVPGALVLDNTRAASAQWLGGSTLRWRRDREDAPTVFDSIGVPLAKIVRTGVEHTESGKAVGHGWAKPVERTHRDYGEWMDKHPLAEGAGTGRSPVRKPENYGERAIEWELFERIVAEDIAALNALPNRRTEAAAGVRSFDQVWDAEIATVAVTRLSQAQLALLLMAAESTAVQRSGAFTLVAGAAAGMGRNRYYHSSLVARAGKHIVARFDPAALHAGAEVFDRDGKWLCRADWLPSAGFGDQEAAQDHNRKRRAWMRDVDRAARNRDSAAEVYEQHGPGPMKPAAPASPKVVRLVPEHAKRPDVARRRELEERRNRGLQALINQ